MTSALFPALGALLPELVLILAAMALLAVDLLRPVGARNAVRWGMAASVVALAGMFAAAQAPDNALGGMFTLDGLALGGQLIVLGILVGTLLLSFPPLEKSPVSSAAHTALLMLSAAALMGVCAARHWVALLILLETSAVALTAVLALRRGDRGGAEAALKYFILSAFASSFIAFGAGLWYLSGGSFLMSGREVWSQADTAAVLLIFAGLAFKCALVPFHMWAPDVYEGGTTPVVAFIATASKTAGFTALARMLLMGGAVGAPGARESLWILAAASMVGGVVLALTQRNMRRMLAYSGISQAGFLLTAFLGGGDTGLGAVGFYIAVYAAMTFGTFAVVAALEEAGEPPETVSFAGFSRRAPLLAGAFAVFMFSLTGVPPTAGFMAKFLAFRGAVTGDYIPLVFLAVMASVVSVGFYVRLLVPVFMEGGSGKKPLRASPGATAIAVVLAIALLVTGVFPSLLISAADFFLAG